MRTDKEIKRQHAKETEFAKSLTLGTKVYCHSIIGEPHDGVVRQIESAPWKLGHGAWVVKCTDKSGGWSLSAITLVEEK